MQNDYLFKSNKELLIDVAEKFRFARREAGYSQEYISEKTGISRQTIMRFEAGENISLINFIALLREVNELGKFSDLLNRIRTQRSLAIKFKEQSK